jgi:hypothetical protein
LDSKQYVDIGKQLVSTVPASVNSAIKKKENWSAFKVGCIRNSKVFFKLKEAFNNY